MTAVNATRLVGEYLRRLEVELMDLPADRRREILDDIRGHIAEERSGMRDESDADLMNLLDRLGDPAEIASEARGGDAAGRTTLPSAGFGTLEVLAIALLLLAWPVGVVLLWSSGAWTRREKLLGTLVPPGGYPGVLLVMSTFRQFASAAEAGPAWVDVTVGAVLFTISLVALLAPIAMAVYLATRLRGRTRDLA